MTSETRNFNDIPAGALFEATQRSIRDQGLKIQSENPSTLEIEAASKVSMKSFGQRITLRMGEIGPVSELTIETSSGQLSDWGEGGSIIAAIFDGVDVNLAQMKAEGRIAAPAPKVYAMGEHAAPPPPQPEPARHYYVAPPKTEQTRVQIVEPPPKAKGSAGGWVLRIALALGMLWLFVSEDGKAFMADLLASSPLKSFFAETDISKYDCDRVSELVKGESLQNIFGGRFKILDVKNATQVSKTDERIVCTGKVLLSNGTDDLMQMSVEKAGDYEVLYRVEPML